MSYLLKKQFASKVLYGLISVLALLGVLELHPPTALTAIVTLLGTTFVIALAEAYSETVAEILVKERKPTIGELRHLWHEVAPIVSSSQPAIWLLLLSLLGILSVETALRLGQYVVIGLLFLYGFRVGQLLHGSLSRQILTGLVMASGGLVIVLIKALLH